MRKSLVVMGLAILLLFIGCAGNQTPSPTSGMATVAQVAATAPALAQQLDNVYAYLVAQKLVPDHLDAATKALAALDAIAPMVQRGAAALQGDNFNWVQFVLQGALVAAQVMGYVLPLL